MSVHYFSAANCPPGTYETKTKKSMTDNRGLEFTVDQQICSPCEPGTYQPNEGSTKCIPCPSGISLVEGAITDENCITCEMTKHTLIFILPIPFNNFSHRNT